MVLGLVAYAIVFIVPLALLWGGLAFIVKSIGASLHRSHHDVVFAAWMLLGWLVVLIAEIAIARMPGTESEVGIDLGLTTFAVLSDGTRITSSR